eukprot:5310764-Pleurochrysis_carterae.AAC.1
MQPTLANTLGVNSCSTPALDAAMHDTPTPRTTHVTRTAYGNGARPCNLWCLRLHRTRLCAVCVLSLYNLDCVSRSYAGAVRRR